MKRLLLFSSFLVSISLLTSCIPTNSVKKTDSNLYVETLLKMYKRTQKANIKTRKTYEIINDKKVIRSITHFDTLGKITNEEYINWSKNYILMDTTFVEYNYKDWFLTSINRIGDERSSNTTYYTRDNDGLLIKMQHDNLRPVTYLLNTENTNPDYYEMIGMVGYRNEIPKEVDWSEITKYTQRFHENGMPFLFKIEEEGIEYLRIETTYYKDFRTKSRKEFYYNRLTSETSFEYDNDKIIAKEIITSFPFEQQDEEVYRPGERPDMRVYEYVYYE